MDHPGRKLKTELTVGVQKLLASLPQPGPFVLIYGAAGRDRPADRDQRPVGRQGQPAAVPARAACEAAAPDQPAPGSGPSCGRYRQNVTAQPWPVTGWSTGSGSTLGKPISASHRVTLHRGRQPGHRIRRRHRSDPRHGIRRGKVIDGGGEQPDQPRTAGIKAAPPGRMPQSRLRRRGKVNCWSRRLALDRHRPPGSARAALAPLKAASCWSSCRAVRRTAVGRDAQQLAAGLQVLIQAADAPLRVERRACRPALRPHHPASCPSAVPARAEHVPGPHSRRTGLAPERPVER